MNKSQTSCNANQILWETQELSLDLLESLVVLLLSFLGMGFSTK